MKIADDHDGFVNCTDNEHEDFYIILDYSPLSIRSGKLLLSLINLFSWTKVKLLINGQISIPNSSITLYHINSQKLW